MHPFLPPSSQLSQLVQLEEAKVPVKQLKHNPAKVQPITPALQALLSKDAELKVGRGGLRLHGCVFHFPRLHSLCTRP